MKPLSDQVKADVISLLNSGASSRSFASRVGVSKSSVNYIRRAYNVNRPSRSAGRPVKLSPAVKRRGVRMITSGEANTTAHAASMLATDGETAVSTETVRRALNEAGLKFGIKKKKLRLLPHHKKA